MNPAKGKNFETYDTLDPSFIGFSKVYPLGLEFLAALSTHIPARNRKAVIYYGWYSQPARGKERGLIERILKHLGLLAELAEHIHSPPSIKPSQGPIVYEPFFDDLPEDEQMELIQQAMN